MEAEGELALVALGSNLGDRRANLGAALAWLAALPETQLVASSSFLETDPVGGPPQGLFLNAAATLRTHLSPRELLTEMLGIEQAMGRIRRERWGPRILDLDLLGYGDLVLDEPDLTLPHPHLHERLFVLEPLVEVAPEWVHPVLKKAVRELLRRA